MLAVIVIDLEIQHLYIEKYMEGSREVIRNYVNSFGCTCSVMIMIL